MGRILCVDLGKKRIGLAVSDPLRIIAQPFKTLVTASRTDSLTRVRQVVIEKDVELVVVGYPLHADGRESPGCREARAFCEELSRTGIRSELFDERDSSRNAREVLAAHGKRVREHRASVDRLAAALILKDYLEFIKEKNNPNHR